MIQRALLFIFACSLKVHAVCLGPNTDIIDLASFQHYGCFFNLYSKGAYLGEGSYGAVRIVTLKVSSKVYAAKFIDGKRTKSLPNEVKKMIFFHDFPPAKTLRFHGLFERKDGWIIVMEYMGDQWMDIADYAYKTDKQTYSRTFQTVFNNALSAIQSIHASGFLHNDVKSENLLVDKNTLDIRVIDLDFMDKRELHRPSAHFRGTYRYSDTMNKKNYNPALNEDYSFAMFVMSCHATKYNWELHDYSKL